LDVDAHAALLVAGVILLGLLGRHGCARPSRSSTRARLADELS
jgi:hypothetical protein